MSIWNPREELRGADFGLIPRSRVRRSLSGRLFHDHMANLTADKGWGFEQDGDKGSASWPHDSQRGGVRPIKCRRARRPVAFPPVGRRQGPLFRIAGKPARGRCFIMATDADAVATGLG